MKNNKDIQVKKPEILAPAGSMDHLIYAVRAGADAVYVGTKNFNARKRAKNFDNDELIEAVKYCHERNVKIYATLNTLVYDDELEGLIEEVKFLASSGIDAIIVQDLAVASIISKTAPGIPLHASTQMTIHNARGVKEAAKMGFKRVVLARELDLNEIEKICVETDIEIEVFVHGALCVSVSGACYLSSVIGTRSGNRGDCAQTCRLNFKSNNRDFALSLKDLSAQDHIKKLTDMGVSSFKIEGRMKRPEYVALSVNSYRRALDGLPVDTNLLRDIFSRSGFTDGYLSGKRDLGMFGYRTEQDKTASSKAASKAGELIRWERQTVPLYMDLNIGNDGIATLRVSDKQNTITLKTDASPKSEKEISYDLALKSLSKTGGTPYFVKELSFTNDNSMFIPPGELNRLRREALDLLSLEKRKVKPYTFIECTFKNTGNLEAKEKEREREREVWLRFWKFDQFFAQDAKYNIFPLGEIERHPDLIKMLKGSLIADMPELVFENNYEKVLSSLKTLKEKGLSRVMAHNISTIAMAKDLGLEVFGGYGLNITNSISAEVYAGLGLKDMTLSFELSANRIAGLNFKGRRGVIGYGYLPLMRLRNCPVKGDKAGCKTCDGSNFLIDRKNIKFPILCAENQYSLLLNSLPLYTANKNIDGIDFDLLYFTIENKNECQEIYKAYLSKKPLLQKVTGGLYFREIK